MPEYSHIGCYRAIRWPGGPDTRRLSPSTSSTPLPLLKPAATSSSVWYSRQTPTSWMSSAQVRVYSSVEIWSHASSHLDPRHTGCFAITTVFSHAQTVVLCSACTSVLCQPTGGKARLTEGEPPISAIACDATDGHFRKLIPSEELSYSSTLSVFLLISMTSWFTHHTIGRLVLPALHAHTDL